MASPSNSFPPLWLLILPPPREETSMVTFRRLFEPALFKVLKDAAERSATAGKAILDIGLSLSGVTPSMERPRSSIYSQAQHALATLYRLICLICAREAIDLQFGNDVDFRVVLIGGSASYRDQENPDLSSFQGPITTLENLANSRRPWNHVYGIDMVSGGGLLQTFVTLRKALPSSAHVPSLEVTQVAHGALVASSDAEQPVSGSHGSVEKRHYSVAVGGTFDHLHAGHKLLLTATALILEPNASSAVTGGRCLTIGITGDELLKNKRYAEVMESWDQRQIVVRDFLAAIIGFDKPEDTIQESQRLDNPGPNGKAVHHKLKAGLTIKCVEISDPFGPTITDPSITALVISGETRAGGKAVNDKRIEKNWSPLEIFEVDVLDAQAEDNVDPEGRVDFHSKISSTEVRRKLHEKSSAVD